MTISEIVGIIASILLALGAISGILIFFFNKRNTDATAAINITKTSKEIEQIEQDIESKYTLQVKTWYNDLQEIKTKHDIALAAKDSSMEKLHVEYLNAIKELAEHRIKVDQFNKATRRLLVTMEVPYWECDSTGSMTYANGAWIKLFGVSQEDGIGEGWDVAIAENERKALILEWQAKVADQADGTLSFTIVNPITKEVIDVKSIYVIIFDSNDDIAKIVGVTVRVNK